MRSCLLALLGALVMVASAWSADPTGPTPVLDPDTGVWSAMLPSEHQAGPTRVEILLPDELLADRRYPVLYILPVEGQGGDRYGDGMREAKKADLANTYGLICVYPSFSKVPWYGDHASDQTVRQESFIRRDLVPWIDARYPTQAEAEGRWLLGFSKSGWGAVTLLLRNRQTFGYAAAWDTPFMLDGSGRDWGPMGIKHVMGSRENLLAYLPSRLARDGAEDLRDRTRLVIAAGKHWQPHCDRYHALLTELRVPHVWRDDLVLEHRWDSGWFAPMAQSLVQTARTPLEAEPE